MGLSSLVLVSLVFWAIRHISVAGVLRQCLYSQAKSAEISL